MVIPFKPRREACLVVADLADSLSLGGVVQTPTTANRTKIIKRQEEAALLSFLAAELDIKYGRMSEYQRDTYHLLTAVLQD